MKEQNGKRQNGNGLERLLQILTIGLAVLSAFLVDWGRGKMAFSPVLLACSLTALLVTDIHRLVHIPRTLVAIITLGAVYPLASGFLEYDTPSQLVEIGRLLTVWLSVFFFQVKTPRVYGSLIVLSLLMVVVASILNDGIEFALLLLVFQFCGLLCLVLLYVHSGQLALRTRFASAIDRFPRADRRRRRVADLLLGQPPVAYQEPSSLPERGRMWDRALVIHLLGMVGTTIFFTIAFFYAVPRVGEGGWRAVREDRKPVVGFGSSIEFRQLEKILESRELVLRVAFSDARTGEPLPPMLGQLYLQGRALAFYDVDARGRVAWHSYEQGMGLPLSPIDAEDQDEIVRADLLMEPTRDTSLFYLSTPFSGAGTPNTLRFDRHAGRLARPGAEETSLRMPYRYALYSTGFMGRTQLPITPVRNYDPRSRHLYYEINAQEKAGLLVFDRSRFPRLAQIANELIADTMGEDNRILRARLLQNHFKDVDIYRYSLDLGDVEARRDPDVDPIEDFVVNHRTGHCAYFASALAMMLRSVGIPSRIVIGFVGGEYNGVGKYYQFRQNDAHAWVEVYLEPEQVPHGLTSQAVSPGGAAWYRLDPTPSSIDAGDANNANATGLDKLLDYAQLIWNDYVLEMNGERQQSAGVYGNRNRQLGGVSRLPLIGPFWTVFTKWWNQGPGEFLLAWRRAGWWNWRGGVVASVLAAAVFATTSLTRMAVRTWRATRVARGKTRRVGATRVAFYRQLEQRLRARGLVRREGQTQREFAVAAAAQLRPGDANASSTLQHLLESIVTQFYRARFGRVPLTVDDLREINAALERLDVALDDSKPGR